MSSPEQENHRRLIIEYLDSQRQGARLRIHLEDLIFAVPDTCIELREALGQYGTQLIDIALMNEWLKESGYRLRVMVVEKDEHGSWAVIEKRA